MHSANNKKKKSAVTLLDIANNLNLNKTTVSKALNHSSDISQETLQRVQEEARRLGYVKTLRRTQNRSTIVGVICPDAESPHYSRMINSLARHLREKGYGMILMLSFYSEEMELTLLDQLQQINVAGIILITEQTGETLENRIISTPMVIIGLNFESDEYDVVSIDERRGIRAIVEHLINQGRRRIAFIGNEMVNQRLKFLREYLHANSVNLPDKYVILDNQSSAQCGYEGVRKLLSLPERPTAIVAGYDLIALGAYRALAEMNIQVPQEISLIGFDDAVYCRYLPTSMSSVNYDIDTECDVAVAVLLGRMQAGDDRGIQAIAIIPKLQIRESSAFNGIAQSQKSLQVQKAEINSKNISNDRQGNC